MNSSMNSTSPSTELGQQFVALYLATGFIVLILCVPINCCVLRLIVKGGLETITLEFFHLNLVTADILMFTYSVCLFVYVHNPSNKAATITMNIVFSLFFSARPLFQCCICLERYLAVVHPIIFLRYKPLRYKVYCSAVSWLIALGCGVSSVFYSVGSKYTYFLILYFLVILIVMLFSLLSVLWALKQPEPGEGRSQREEGYNVKMRAFRIIVICAVFTVISYLPGILSLSQSLSNTGYQFGLAIGILITISSGLFNQMIYLNRTVKWPCLLGLEI